MLSLEAYGAAYTLQGNSEREVGKTGARPYQVYEAIVCAAYDRFRGRYPGSVVHVLVRKCVSLGAQS